MLGHMSAPRASGDDRTLTVPNAITALRLGFIPVFLALLAKPEARGRLAAAVLLGGLGVSDGLDGYIARRFDQVSTLGKVADPLVDRALVLSATGGAIAIRALPRWLIALVLTREVLVVGAGLVLAAAGAPRIDVNRAGKAGTFGMMVALPLFIMGASPFRWRAGARRLASVAAIGGQLFGWVAVAGYVPAAIDALEKRKEPASGDSAGSRLWGLARGGARGKAVGTEGGTAGGEQ